VCGRIFILNNPIGVAPLGIVNLGSAANYVILAKSAITNVPASIITGDIALSPAAASDISGFALVAATGYATSSQITGKVFAADMADPIPITLTTAAEDMITAYNDAAGRQSPDYTEMGTGDIGSKHFYPVYTNGPVRLLHLQMLPFWWSIFYTFA
jgi:hypothetical protein